MAALDFANLDLIHTHHYLLGCLLFLPFLAIGYWRAPLPRCVAFLSGLAVVPSAPFSAFLQNTYWTPVRIGSGSWGVEDAFFGFAVGTIVWWLATWPFATRIRFDFTYKRFFLRYSMIVLSAMAVYLLAVDAGVDAMTSLLLLHFAVSAFFFFRMPEYRVLQVSGLTFFALFYFVYFHAFVAMTDNGYTSWESMGPWSVFIFGLPIGEGLWACAFATSHPVLVAYCAGGRMEVKKDGEAMARA